MAHAERTHRIRIGRAFTLVEVLFSLLIIFLLMGILLAAFHYAMKSAHDVMGKQTVSATKMAVNQFQDQFHFSPPLVKDLGFPVGSGDPLSGSLPQVYALSNQAERQFLQGGTVAALPVPDMRFSIYSLSYYIMGVLDKDADGVAGPGFTAPARDGGFTKKGPRHGPFFDAGKNEQAVYATDATKGRIELRDDNGVALRYYRWEHPTSGGPVIGQQNVKINDSLHVPLMVGDPETDMELRSAKWAIVGAGRDGVFGDEYHLPTSHPQYVEKAELAARLNIDLNSSPAEYLAAGMKDNAVEVGR